MASWKVSMPLPISSTLLLVAASAAWQAGARLFVLAANPALERRAKQPSGSLFWCAGPASPPTHPSPCASGTPPTRDEKVFFRCSLLESIWLFMGQSVLKNEMTRVTQLQALPLWRRNLLGWVFLMFGAHFTLSAIGPLGCAVRGVEQWELVAAAGDPKIGQSSRVDARWEKESRSFHKKPREVAGRPQLMASH